MVNKPIFQDDGNGPYLCEGVTPEELLAWETSSGMKWENGSLIPLPLTLEQVQIKLTQLVQNHLDTKARVNGYDSIFTACTYDGDINPAWDLEGKRYKKWRSLVWQHCISLMGEVVAGTKPIPTELELISGLPIFEEVT